MNSINSNLEKLEKTNLERHEKFNAWLRNIITIAAGLIAVLISLKSKKSLDAPTHFLFVFTIGLLCSGILSGCIVLYHEIYLLDKQQSCIKDYILKLTRDKNSETLVQYLTNHKYYKFTLKFTILSFILALISLTIYAYLIDK
jgi:hypothetical protein